MSKLITYDLRKPGQDYTKLIDAIKTYSYCKIAESAWVINSSDSAKNIRDHLKRYIDSNDVLFVGTLNGEAAWYGESSTVSDWLQKYV